MQFHSLEEASMKDFVSSLWLRVFVLVAPFSLAWVASSILNPSGSGWTGLAGVCSTLPAAFWLSRKWAPPVALTLHLPEGARSR
jgi:hypothetical protein